MDPLSFPDALHEAEAFLTKASQILDPFLARINEDERSSLPRPPSEFPVAAQTLVEALADHPALAEVAHVHPQQITVPLSKNHQLVPVLLATEELLQRLKDTRLQWLADAWRSSLKVYAVAKGVERADPTLRIVIDPVSAVFGSGRRAKDEPLKADK